jgi:hypothetical protein
LYTEVTNAGLTDTDTDTITMEKKQASSNKQLEGGGEFGGCDAGCDSEAQITPSAVLEALLRTLDGQFQGKIKTKKKTDHCNRPLVRNDNGVIKSSITKCMCVRELQVSCQTRAPKVDSSNKLVHEGIGQGN